MKKIYSKPGILFEDFQMSTNIAGNCDEIVGNQSKDTCAYITRTGLSVFTSALVGICSTHEDDGEYNGFCYHVPIDTKSLFNS